METHADTTSCKQPCVWVFQNVGKCGVGEVCVWGGGEPWLQWMAEEGCNEPTQRAGKKEPGVAVAEPPQQRGVRTNPAMVAATGGGRSIGVR